MQIKILLFMLLIAMMVIGYIRGAGMVDSGVSSIMCAVIGGIFSSCLTQLEEK